MLVVLRYAVNNYAQVYLERMEKIMSKYTPPMQAVLTTLPVGDCVEGPTVTIMAMYRRGLCYEVERIDSGRQRAKLTYMGHEARVEVARANGLDLLKTLDEVRSNRITSNGNLRLNRARHAAEMVAINLVGRALTVEEKRLVSEVTERVIDVFEEGTTRIHICPQCTFVVGGDGIDTTPCPEHGLRQSFPFGFGVTDLAVRCCSP